MGVDYIWLLPVYPIGDTNRKGSFGSPYSISNFRGINPEHGIFLFYIPFLTPCSPPCLFRIILAV